MQYIVVEVADTVDVSGLVVADTVKVSKGTIAVDAKLVGKCQWVNPTAATLVEHTHGVSASGPVAVSGTTGAPIPKSQ